MIRFLPNLDPIGSDISLSPLEVTASVVIVDNGIDCLWYPGVMDPPTADRLAFTIMQGSSVEAFRVDLKLILPSATELRAETSELDQLVGEPLRAKLHAG